ncbi:transcription factor Ouib-like [Malaya genurostris]|uniref:transcription factor Ouib-like n=1 Tax=Malaya genurostris TaxID=325434 RepID=UPI0026F3D276|nr:transcription factor Ouib-like [Malaya genurostris]
MSTISELSQCCRCCLKKRSDKINIFVTLDEFASQICDLLVDCGGIIVSENDSFSKSICSSCLTDLSNAVRFRERCLKTDGVLKRAHITGQEDLVATNSPVEKSMELQPELGGSEQLENLYCGFPGFEPYEEDPLADDSQDEHENQIIFENHNEMRQTDITSEMNIHDPKHAFENTVNLLSGTPGQKTKRIKKFCKPKVNVEFICTVCDFKYASHNGYMKHMRMHPDFRPFKCETCGEAFISKMSLTKHTLSIHHMG